MTCVQENADKVDWVEMSIKGDLQQKDSSRSERKALQDSRMTSYGGWFGDRRQSC